MFYKVFMKAVIDLYRLKEGDFFYLYKNDDVLNGKRENYQIRDIFSSNTKLKIFIALRDDKGTVAFTEDRPVYVDDATWHLRRH